jgi:hypothetical protein
MRTTRKQWRHVPDKRLVTWTPDMDAALSSGRASGKSWDAIAHRIGVCHQTALSRAVELGIPTGRINGPEWPAERVEKMLSLRAQGLSESRTAKLLGTSKNAVSGKLWRVSRQSAVVSA